MGVEFYGWKIWRQFHVCSRCSDVKMEKWKEPKLEFSLKQACNLTVWLLCWGNVKFFLFPRVFPGGACRMVVSKDCVSNKAKAHSPSKAN